MLEYDSIVSIPGYKVDKIESSEPLFVPLRCINKVRCPFCASKFLRKKCPRKWGRAGRASNFLIGAQDWRHEAVKR